MAGTIPVDGNMTAQALGDALTRHEQTMFEQVTGLTIDTTQARNLVTTVSTDASLGVLSVCAAGGESPGTKVLSTTVYISGTQTEVDLYRLPLS